MRIAQDGKSTLYDWRPGGCPLPWLTSYCALNNARIAIVGDSIGGDLFFERTAWAIDTPCARSKHEGIS